MKTKNISSFTLAAVVSLLAVTAGAQTAKRTVFKSDTIDFGAGGTLTVTGAPSGSVRIEGWNRNEIEVSAEISLEAANEADLAKLAEVTGFVFDTSFNHLRITSVGTHDKAYLKKSGKKFPKNLIGLPFRIDYAVKVPRYCDLNITGGNGDFSVSGVDGNMRINFIKGNASMSLDGGAVQAIFGTGDVTVKIPTRAWRGRFADVSLSSGTMSVFLPPGLNSLLDAEILRSGSIVNNFAELKPRTRSDKFTDRLMVAKAGNGGVPLKFTVGEGSLNIDTVK